MNKALITKFCILNTYVELFVFKYQFSANVQVNASFHPRASLSLYTDLLGWRLETYFPNLSAGSCIVPVNVVFFWLSNDP